MKDESTLRFKARQALTAGKLPNARPERIWGGPGFGACCTVCSQPVKGDEIGLELEFARDGAAADPSNPHVHLQCFAAWESECQNLGTTPVAAAAAGIAAVTCPASEVKSGKNGQGRVLPAADNDGTISVRERNTSNKRGPA
jgi:hypothetical protein